MNLEQIKSLNVSASALMVELYDKCELISSCAIGVSIFKCDDCIVKFATEELGLYQLKKERANYKKAPEFMLPILYSSPNKDIQAYALADNFTTEEELEEFLGKSVYQFTVENLDYIKAIEACGLDVAEQTHYLNLGVLDSKLVFTQYSVDEEIENSYESYGKVY